MFAAALSPDAGKRFVAVSGFGVKTEAVAVLDRTTNAVAHLLDDNLETQTIWAVSGAAQGVGAV